MMCIYFCIGMMFTSSHMCGMMLLFSDMLYMLVRYASPSSHMCFRFLMLTYQALWSCCFCFVLLSLVVVVCSLCVFPSMCLFVLCILCLTVLMNCLLNAFAISVGVMIVFSLTDIVLFCVFVFIG